MGDAPLIDLQVLAVPAFGFSLPRSGCISWPRVARLGERTLGIRPRQFLFSMPAANMKPFMWQTPWNRPPGDVAQPHKGEN